MPAYVPVEIRFENGIERIPWSGCWLWTKGVNGAGYGSIGVKGKYVMAHRLSYELHKGDIPKGFSVLHSCDIPCCVNPQHLSVGTVRDNTIDAQRKGRMRQSLTFGAYQVKRRYRTHCPQGHEYTADNIILQKNGARVCRTCRRALRARIWKEQKR